MKLRNDVDAHALEQSSLSVIAMGDALERFRFFVIAKGEALKQSIKILYARKAELFTRFLVRVRPVAIAVAAVRKQIFHAAAQSRFRLAEEIRDLVFLFDEEHRHLVAALDGGAEHEEVFLVGNHALVFDVADHVRVLEDRLGLFLDAFLVDSDDDV